jgi:membrane-associated phospholipid phosphatase
LYGLAALTSYSLVHANEHWVSDVLAGAGLGLGAAFLVIERERNRANSSCEESGKLRVYPLFSGVRVVYSL